ncbi:hypothetical protein ACMGGR_00835 [Erwinia sp. BNK-24-b]|uniref:hypothetical protein n=1 Tax=unclassified Erwinia TaxID=2622719 RepID=UPI0039BF0A73
MKRNNIPAFLFLVLTAFFSYSCYADNVDEVSFVGKRYEIYITESDCQHAVDCNDVKARLIDKDKQKKYKVTGEAIVTGFGRNLRGYTLYHGSYKYELSRPEIRPDTVVDLSQWLLDVYKKTERGTFDKIFSESGEVNI